MTQRCLYLAAALLFLPLVVFGVIVAGNETAWRHAQTWRVKITGYDPRDLLYGHYLNFRFDWQWKVGNSRLACSRDQKCFLCFDPSGPAAPGVLFPLVSYEPNETATQRCTSRLPVHTDAAMQDRGEINPERANRYLIPEAEAPILEKLLRDRNRNLSINLMVLPSGGHRFGELYVDNVPWRDWLRQHPENLGP